VPGYEAVSWFGLFGPAGMAPDVVAKVNGEVRALFADAEFQKTFLDRYLFQSTAGTPEELMTFVRSEEPKWRKIIQDANIKVQ
jgi:tripartite-type tricarboxylate transporter receptor subunit TctC